MLLIGESGSGKTGSLASLAQAGYELAIIDFDSGIDILAKLLHNNKDAMSRVHFENCSDELQNVGGDILPKGVPKGFAKALKLMTKWDEKAGASDDLGRPSEWGRNKILVLDSLTHMGNCAMRRVQALNSHSGKNPTQPEWGAAQQDIEAVLALLYGESFQCHVIVISHIRYIGGQPGDDDKPADPRPMVGYPNSLGVALPPKIAGYFNTMLLCKMDGAGMMAKRNIYTVPDGLIGVKQTLMDRIPKKLSIETGMAEFFDKYLES